PRAGPFVSSYFGIVIPYPTRADGPASYNCHRYYRADRGLSTVSLIRRLETEFVRRGRIFFGFAGRFGRVPRALTMPGTGAGPKDKKEMLGEPAGLRLTHRLWYGTRAFPPIGGAAN